MSSNYVNIDVPKYFSACYVDQCQVTKGMRGKNRTIFCSTMSTMCCLPSYEARLIQFIRSSR